MKIFGLVKWHGIFGAATGTTRHASSNGRQRSQIVHYAEYLEKKFKLFPSYGSQFSLTVIS